VVPWLACSSCDVPSAARVASRGHVIGGDIPTTREVHDAFERLIAEQEQFAASLRDEAGGLERSAADAVAPASRFRLRMARVRKHTATNARISACRSSSVHWPHWS
jgi:hypothetical protein